jgi:hypothetical protein
VKQPFPSASTWDSLGMTGQQICLTSGLMLLTSLKIQSVMWIVKIKIRSYGGDYNGNCRILVALVHSLLSCL